MDDVLNNVLNAHEHSESEDSDGIYSETSKHENFIDSDLEIISSSTDGAESRREHEVTPDNKLGGDPATNRFIDEHFGST